MLLDALYENVIPRVTQKIVIPVNKLIEFKSIKNKYLTTQLIEQFLSNPLWFIRGGSIQRRQLIKFNLTATIYIINKIQKFRSLALFFCVACSVLKCLNNIFKDILLGFFFFKWHFKNIKKKKKNFWGKKKKI